MNKLEAIMEALSCASVGDEIIIHGEDGRINYIVELKAKEESK